ncbi:GNAT family N-acetyltransferase [Sulfitobacter noctilucae]|uniref:GNAT family N-acetyltransferase n=1 Tax=Sulfitobacter noctilucae TaxID=1342302 RepID=UPI001F4D2D83|nr:GNAT family N-acetyltransferase [Sulfitobacter noctilucae]
MSELFAAAEATWPAARCWQDHGFTLRDGQGGGQRVSAATADGPVTAAQIDAAEGAMREMGQTPLFRLLGDAPDLDEALVARGYIAKDPTTVYVLPIEQLTDKDIPPVTAFSIWEPLAIMNEVWETDGVGQARRDVMARAACKTAVLSRWNEKPGGVAFAAVHGKICMVHAVVVLAHQRRQGVAQWMMRRAAFWGQAQGATHMAVLCVDDNESANALYRALGFAAMGGYHYRKHPD